MQRIIRNEVAFFCCDIQEAFRPSIFQFDHIVQTASILIQAAKLFDAPLFVSEQYPEKLGKTVKELDLVHAELVFPKTEFSMCNSEVDKILYDKDYPDDFANKCTAVVLFGIEAHVCIQQTALDLLAKHIHVFLVTDAISSSRPLDRSTALHRLSQAGAILISAESVLFELLGNKDEPEFKQALQLAKSLGSFYRENSHKCLSSL